MAKITAEQIVEILIQDRFSVASGEKVRGYVHLKNFRPSMGWKGELRYLDLWVLELSPASGMMAHAVEVKISRTDWLRELKLPLKRRPAEACSNFMWAAAPLGLIKPEELPPFWGLMEIDPDAIHAYERVKMTHPADHRDKARPSWAFVGSALATYIRNKEEKAS